MKRHGLVLLAVVVAGLVGLAVAQEVTSINVVGFTKIIAPPAPDLVMFSCMFDPVGCDPRVGGTNYLRDLFGTNQLAKHDSNPARADRIYKFIPPDKYEIYFMKNDGQFYNATNASVPVNPPVLAGDAFWFRQPSTATNAKELILAGQVVEVATNLQGMIANFQMLGYPFTSDVGINETGFKDSPGSTKHDTNPARADRLYVYMGGGEYAIYGLKNDGWHSVIGYATNAPTTDVIPLGRGFWYNAKTGGWTWVEGNRYLGNL